MTAWTNAAITKVFHNYPGKYKEITYHIAGVAGDTGGTLTTNFKKIFNAVVTEQTTAAAEADVAKAIIGNTIVVTYTNPAAAHTVYITVTGQM